MLKNISKPTDCRCLQETDNDTIVEKLMTSFILEIFFNHVAGNAEVKASEEVVKNPFWRCIAGIYSKGHFFIVQNHKFL